MARGEERILNRYLIETAGSRRDAFVLSMRKSAPPPAGSALSALYGYDAIRRALSQEQVIRPGIGHCIRAV